MLTLSLDSLGNVAKSMFLDVVSVLAGEDCSHALMAWEAWHGAAAIDAFEALTSRGLISTERPKGWRCEDLVLQVHDVMQSLGRNMLQGAAIHKAYGARMRLENGNAIDPQVCLLGPAICLPS